MKNLLLILILWLGSCSNQQLVSKHTNHTDTVVIHDTVYINDKYDWQEKFGLTHDPDRDSISGKPVQFYINNPKCAGIAINFYYGMYRPMDDYVVADLLALATTDNYDLRPFYRWCLDKTIEVSDGALSEFPGLPARQYAEKFPKEFFEYMDSSTANDQEWIDLIYYGGYYVGENFSLPMARKNFATAMKKNCADCNAAMLQRIDKFAADCFPLKHND